MKRAVRKWWEGTYEEEPPDSPFLMPFLRRHWTARAAHTVVKFARTEWKWLIGISLTVIALILAYLRLP